MRGKVIRYGDDINTDVIFPGRYLAITEPEEMAKHAMEDLDKDFLKKVKERSIIVAGKNFGCGSSREQAVICLKYAGIRAIVARSFARIFFRNAINQGIPVVELEDTSGIEDGEEIEIDLDEGTVRNLTKGEDYRFKPLPDFIRKIIDSGGLLNYTKERINR
ncbi:MAG TPA: 3-isopropylmalate dehydratase small subunit [Thermoplasmatales archaeon]|nr:3-isopropylmalate dehydratase small subunit [Thermoplasmatales archaeon]HEX17260.1 3-isopropylmalate dehydratase small subunit [Thermoplasmatales archaeon]